MVVGGASAAAVGGGRTVIRLDELLQNSSRTLKMEDFPSQYADEDAPPALIAFTANKDHAPHGVAFSEQAIVAAAKHQAFLYYIGSERERLTSLLPDKHMVSLVHMLIVPLSAGVTSVEFTEMRYREAMPNLIEELYDNQITAVWVDEHHLSDLRQATKVQRFALPAEFRLYLVPTRPLTDKHVEGLGDIIVPCYAQTEAGGVVSVGVKGELHTCDSALKGRARILGAGGPVGGVCLKILSEKGDTVSGEKVGELVVYSPQVMTSYEATVPGSAYLGPDLSLHTGDRARWSFDAAGKPHLVIVSREEQFVKRGGVEVNIFDLESVLLRVVGVKDVRVIPFEHNKFGHELAAFVITLKKAQVTQENLWSNLLEYFPWDVVPKIFMLADSAQVTTIPGLPELQAQLSRFANADFSRAPKR
jgi:acyl-CoA synthetase (AMP-forming)/AMP-acid ligase II